MNMKLKKDNLPNLFDQYDKEENRVTNSLLQTLAFSTRITEHFLNSIIREISREEMSLIELSEQLVPIIKRTNVSNARKMNDSVPDGWLILRRKDSSVAFVVVVESKIKKSSATKSQLIRHLVKANKQFEPDKNALVLLITPDDSDPFPRWIPEEGLYKWKNWREVYSFARNERKLYKNSAVRILLENFEEFIEMKELAGFQGIDFSEGFKKEKARRILRTLMQEIKAEFLKTYPKLSKEKGNVSDPWNVFAPEDARQFNQGIHFALGLEERSLNLLLTVPNQSVQGWHRLKSIMTSEQAELGSLLSKLRYKLPNLVLMFQQRHFIARRIPFMDGKVEVDIDTTEFGGEKENQSKVKKNRQLFELFVSAVKDAPVSINKEMNFITRFYYEDRKYKGLIKKANFRKTVISALDAFKPVYDFLTK